MKIKVFTTPNIAIAIYRYLCYSFRKFVVYMHGTIPCPSFGGTKLICVWKKKGMNANVDFNLLYLVYSCVYMNCVYCIFVLVWLGPINIRHKKIIFS